MSKSKAELSVGERLLLDYIKFRTRQGYPFFESNSTIAPNVGFTERTTKELINRLVRKGYLFKCKDERNRRQLILTELTHAQTYNNFQELTKANLIEELNHQRQDNKNMERDMKISQDAVDTWRSRYYAEERKVKKLEQQVAELQRQLNALQSTQTPQTDNTTTIKEEYSNNNESIVRTDNISVGSIPNRNNGYESTGNTECLDAETLIGSIMSKYKLETN